MNASVKSKETDSCLSANICQHRHKHDHLLDSVNQPLSGREHIESLSNGFGTNRSNNKYKLKSLKRRSSESESNFLRTKRQA